jgi:general secretion pathway protein C
MIDRLARRYFPWIVATLLLLCAYAHARVANALVAASFLPDPRALAATHETRLVPEPPPNQPGPSAQPIIDRNPFDSFTGPLGEENVIEPPSPPVVTDPLLAPKCEGLRVESTAVASDPLWSTAVVEAPDETRGKLRRVGDQVGTLRVAYIGFNRVKASPTVWLVDGDQLCQAHVFDAEVKTLKKKKRHKRPRRAKGKAAKAPKKNPKQTPRLPKDIASKIQRVNATEFVVDRRAVDQILEQQAALMRAVRLRPNQKNGKVASLTVNRIRKGTLLGTLGVRNGDQLQSINGFSLTSPEKALEAYARLRTAPELTLELVRRGKPIAIQYRIR